MIGIRKALALSVSQRFLSYAIQFGSTIILARLITPAQTGIFSLAVGLVAIAQMFRDFGVGEYLVQEKQIDKEVLETAFGISLALSSAVGLLLLALADPVAMFYREPTVATVVRILSINFFLVPIGYVANAMLTRDMRFDILLVIQTTSAVIAAVASITLAWADYGAMGLAWGLVAGGVANVVGLAVFSPAQMVYRPTFKGWARIGRFGVYKTSSFLLEQVVKRAPDFFISRAQGFAASGLYSRANGLAEAFSDFLGTAVYRVALPSFAKVRNEGLPLGQAYLHANRLLACLPLSFFSFTAVFAEPIVLTLLGDQWGGAVTPMRWLAVSAIIITPAMLAAPLLTANNTIQRLVKVQLITNPVQLVLVAAASLHSIEMVAATGIISATLRLILIHREMRRVTLVNAREMFGAMAPSLAVASLALIAPALFLIWAVSTELSPALACLGGATLYGCCWLGSVHLLRHPYRSEVGRIVASLRVQRSAIDR